jgi:hypothetical protein
MITHTKSEEKLVTIHPLTERMKEWELRIKSHKNIVRITTQNRNIFFSLLHKENDLDSYAISPIYYTMTGRKGLWIYEDCHAYIPLCWHPNIEDQILIFMPQGNNKENLSILKKIVSEIPTPPMGIKLARVKRDFKCITDQTITFTPVEESVLDWRYPVRILSTESVGKMQGFHCSRKMRNKIKIAQLNEIIIEPLSIKHTNPILTFVNLWARDRAEDEKEFENLTAPYLEFLTFLNEPDFNLDGLVFFINNCIQAVVVWEWPSPQSIMANIWISLSNKAFTGIAEFAMQKTAIALDAKGIPYLNFGGSETKGLDDYKKKYEPVYNIELQSIEVTYQNAELIPEGFGVG